MAQFTKPKNTNDLPDPALGANKWEFAQMAEIVGELNLRSSLALYVEDQVISLANYIASVVHAFSQQGVPHHNIVCLTPDKISANENFIKSTGAKPMYAKTFPLLLINHAAASILETLNRVMGETVTPEALQAAYQYFLNNFHAVFAVGQPSKYNVVPGQTAVQSQHAAYIGTLIDVLKTGHPEIAALMSGELTDRVLLEVPQTLAVLDYDLSGMPSTNITKLLMNLAILSIREPSVAIVTQFPNKVDLTIPKTFGIGDTMVRSVIAKGQKDITQEVQAVLVKEG